ncbi:hypothetical protein [Haliangium sp.]|uniref:hypothetical protein n=1 Tax=Haliangium sp. TaxID=2663208 RepID=UPI003D0D8C73
MTAVLIDADAFLFARSLGLLALVERQASPTFTLIATRYVALKELNQVQEYIHALGEQGLLIIQRVPPSAVVKLKKRSRTVKGLPRLDDGELEAITWSLSQPKADRPRFISNDHGAQKGAAYFKIPWGDIMDLAIEMLDAGVAEDTDLRVALETWDNPVQQRGRPKDWCGYDQTLASRRGQRTG